MLSILGQTVDEYVKKRNQQDLSEILIVTAFSMVNFPTKPSEIKGGNHWVPY